MKGYYQQSLDNEALSDDEFEFSQMYGRGQQ
jgi:hypothetical protein